MFVFVFITTIMIGLEGVFGVPAAIIWCFIFSAFSCDDFDDGTRFLKRDLSMWKRRAEGRCLREANWMPGRYRIHEHTEQRRRRFLA